MDIVIKCQGCGKECKVSEFAAEDTLTCGTCHSPLHMPELDRGPRLQVRKGHGDERPVLSGDENVLSNMVAAATGTVAADRPSATMQDVHKVRGKVKKPARLIGWVIFVLIAGLLVGAQYYMTQYKHPEWMTYYEWTRYILMAVTFLALLIVAADDSYLQAILCVLVPFYALYYAVSRVEVALLRGSFLAVVVALASELYFLRDKAVISEAQVHVEQFITDVGNLIQRAGDSPDVPVSPRRSRKPTS